MSHHCVCCHVSTNEAPILRKASLDRTNYSKSKSLSHVICLWLPRSHVLSIFDQQTAYCAFFDCYCHSCLYDNKEIWWTIFLPSKLIPIVCIMFFLALGDFNLLTRGRCYQYNFTENQDHFCAYDVITYLGRFFILF